MFSRRKWLKFSLRSAIALMLTLVISACVVRRANESNSASTVADSSTAITVYTALEDDQIQNYLTLFQQEHPDIKVNTVRDSTGIVTAKLLAEKDNPRADVVWGLAVSSLLVADSQGMLEPYAPTGLERVRSQFRDERNPPHWVGIDAWMSAFCVNTVEMEKRNLPT